MASARGEATWDTISTIGIGYDEMRVLIIEDDARIASFVRGGLEDESHVVLVAPDVPSGLHHATDPSLNMIILDLMLPGGSGEELLAELRARGVETPVIVLTAKDSVRSKVASLDLGADDYLTKPFSFSELAARIRALKRRSRGSTTNRVQVGDLALDPRRREAQRGKTRIELTAREFDLLFFLVENEGQVLTRRILAESVWDEQFESFSNVIDVHINRLRKKVDRGFDAKLIHTVRGVGYVLRADS